MSPALFLFALLVTVVGTNSPSPSSVPAEPPKQQQRVQRTIAEFQEVWDKYMAPHAPYEYAKPLAQLLIRLARHSRDELPDTLNEQILHATVKAFVQNHDRLTLQLSLHVVAVLLENQSAWVATMETSMLGNLIQMMLVRISSSETDERTTTLHSLRVLSALAKDHRGAEMLSHEPGALFAIGDLLSANQILYKADVQPRDGKLSMGTKTDNLARHVLTIYSSIIAVAGGAKAVLKDAKMENKLERFMHNQPEGVLRTQAKEVIQRARGALEASAQHQPSSRNNNRWGYAELVFLFPLSITLYICSARYQGAQAAAHGGTGKRSKRPSKPPKVAK
eukprot:TRINITY_DN61070_c0_g1_i1.p1 TRINITY_DN61070_c0_g1~~TRINITY_DN61070_c0_g1_i1.p1  ORF type:complete len:335 (+),score=16.62 TRINITY_DN61070_c0_g1_i1:28-1032(+)